MKEKDIFKNIEMLSQPLLTEDGFLNEACMNELGKAITDMPKTFERLSDDKEWSDKRLTFKHEITGAFAKWAIIQSPYSCPDKIEEVVKYLDACLEREIDWGNCGFVEFSLCDISELLYNILYEQGVTYFDNWNKSKKGNIEIQVVSRCSSKLDPDYDFIDLHALLRNVCLDIRLERRDKDRSRKEFKEKYDDKE